MILLLAFQYSVFTIVLPEKGEYLYGLESFLATFTGVFFAELADKTQLVGIGMAAKTGKPASVWLGPEVIRYLGASLFIIIGVLMFCKIL